MKTHNVPLIVGLFSLASRALRICAKLQESSCKPFVVRLLDSGSGADFTDDGDYDTTGVSPMATQVHLIPELETVAIRHDPSGTPSAGGMSNHHEFDSGYMSSYDTRGTYYVFGRSLEETADSKTGLHRSFVRSVCSFGTGAIVMGSKSIYCKLAPSASNNIEKFCKDIAVVNQLFPTMSNQDPKIHVYCNMSTHSALTVLEVEGALQNFPFQGSTDSPDFSEESESVDYYNLMQKSCIGNGFSRVVHYRGAMVFRCDNNVFFTSIGRHNGQLIVPQVNEIYASRTAVAIHFKNKTVEIVSDTASSNLAIGTLVEQLYTSPVSECFVSVSNTGAISSWGESYCSSYAGGSDDIVSFKEVEEFIFDLVDVKFTAGAIFIICRDGTVVSWGKRSDGALGKFKYKVAFDDVGKPMFASNAGAFIYQQVDGGLAYSGSRTYGGVVDGNVVSFVNGAIKDLLPLPNGFAVRTLNDELAVWSKSETYLFGEHSVVSSTRYSDKFHLPLHAGGYLFALTKRDCQASEWVAASECVNGYQSFTRHVTQASMNTPCSLPLSQTITCGEETSTTTASPKEEGTLELKKPIIVGSVAASCIVGAITLWIKRRAVVNETEL